MAEHRVSLGDQVSPSGGSRRAYIEGLGPTSCNHPAIGSPDDTPYTRHNPWV